MATARSIAVYCAAAIRVLRVYHGGRDPQHRGRDRALAAAGIDVTLVVPSDWPEPEAPVEHEPFSVVEVAVRRPGDVNRHVPTGDLARVLRDAQADVLDVHEEPVSLAARAWLRAAPRTLPVVLYTAQNIDKRYPPPFARYERQALARAAAVYPCSRQAAAVARGKGFPGVVDVLPLGFDERVFTPGAQRVDDGELVLGFVGRFVPEKGIADAVRIRDELASLRPTRLLAVGSGPEAARVRDREGVEHVGWADAAGLAAAYRRMHVLLVPSVATASWAEQFGRVAVEAQASGAVVAAYASGALPEVLGDAGLLAGEGERTALARAVAQLLDDPQRYEDLRARGFELSAQRTWTRVAERQAALYEAARAPRAARPVGRRAARAEFGPTAATPLGRRPPALPRPLLRLLAGLGRRGRAAVPPSARE